MSDNLDDLIEQLKNIRIQEEQIWKQEEKLREEADHVLLRIQSVRRGQQELTRQVQAQQETTGQIAKTALGPLRKGDRIYITNKITTPPGREADINDRQATVTLVTNPWVYFTTDNGFETKQYAKNLCKIPDNSR